MFKLKNLLILGLLPFLSSSCSAAVEKEWTVYIHMNGDNSLCNYTATNLNQLKTVDVSAAANIIVAYDCSKQNDSKLMELHGKQVVTLDQGHEYDMGDWRWFADTADKVLTDYPARHNMIVIWNHGSGWRLNEWGIGVSRGVSYDDQSGNHITTEQIGQALEQIGRHHHIDILGYDACLMQMAEVGFEVGSQYVDYFLGSEETIPGAGWDYTGMVNSLLHKPGAVELGTSIIGAYAKEYSTEKDVTLSLTKASAVEELATAWRDYLASGPDMTKIAAAMNGSIKYAYDDYKDFGTALNLMGAPADLKAAYARAVIYNWGNGTGLSIEYAATAPNQYLDLKFPQFTGWLR